MKKIFLIFIFIISLSNQSFAQNLDSLWKVYNDKSQVVTNRIDALRIMAKGFMYNKPDSSIKLCELELKLARTLPPEIINKYSAPAFYITGISYRNKSKVPKALEYTFKALKIWEEMGEMGDGISWCYMNIGLVYFSQSNLTKALEYYFKALPLCEKRNDKWGIST